MITAIDIMRVYFKQMDMCATTDFHASADDRARLNDIASGMRLMAEAVIELIDLDNAVDDYVEREVNHEGV